MAELNSSGSVTAINTFGAAGLVSRNVTGYGNTLYAFDERGSVAHRTYQDGHLTSSDLYDGFGKQRAGASDAFGFGGQAGYYTDTETGLLLCTNRFYDPQQGRFLTRDPLGYDGGINLYGYTGNNPVNDSDPSGMMPVFALAGGGALGGGALLGEGSIGVGGAAVGAVLWPVVAVVGVAAVSWEAGTFIGNHIANGFHAQEGLAAPYYARPIPPDKAYPGTDRSAQAKHDPTSDYDTAKTPLIGHELPSGKTVDDALQDAWNNPVAGDWKDHKQVYGKPGYPVNRNGDEWLDLRCGGGKVHGFPVSGPK